MRELNRKINKRDVYLSVIGIIRATERKKALNCVFDYKIFILSYFVDEILNFKEWLPKTNLVLVSRKIISFYYKMGIAYLLHFDRARLTIFRLFNMGSNYE